MMARIATTIQKKNTTMPGMAYPATVLALATGHQLPTAARLIRRVFTGDGNAGLQPFGGRDYIRTAGETAQRLCADLTWRLTTILGADHRSLRSALSSALRRDADGAWRHFPIHQADRLDTAATV
jgi:hypothetical protein